MAGRAARAGSGAQKRPTGKGHGKRDNSLMRGLRDCGTGLEVSCTFVLSKYLSECNYIPQDL